MGRKRPRDKVPGVDVSGPMVLPSHDLADGLGKRMVLQAMVSRPHGLAATPWSLGMGEADRTNDKKEERLGWITRAVPETRGLTDFEPFFNGNVIKGHNNKKKTQQRAESSKKRSALEVMAATASPWSRRRSPSKEEEELSKES